jgi:hypothetical protein
MEALGVLSSLFFSKSTAAQFAEERKADRKKWNIRDATRASLTSLIELTDCLGPEAQGLRTQFADLTGEGRKGGRESMN